MAPLLDIVRETVYKYGRHGVNVKFYPIFDEIRQTYAITALPMPDREEGMDVVVMARVAGEYVIIEEDNTDKPLVDALMSAGIPRQQIILAYEGETNPEVQ